MALTEWLEVDVLGVLLFRHLVHAECLAVGVDIVEHVGILVTPQPLVFPIETQRVSRGEQLTQTFFADVNCVRPIRLASY